MIFGFSAYTRNLQSVLYRYRKKVYRKAEKWNNWKNSKDFTEIEML